MSEYQKKEYDGLNIGNGWVQTTKKTGKSYISFSMTDKEGEYFEDFAKYLENPKGYKVQLWKNNKKKTDKSPDYRLVAFPMNEQKMGKSFPENDKEDLPL